MISALLTVRDEVEDSCSSCLAHENASIITHLIDLGGIVEQARESDILTQITSQDLIGSRKMDRPEDKHRCDYHRHIDLIEMINWH